MQEDARKQNASTCMQLNTSLLTSFRACFDDPMTSDVIMNAGDTSLHAHKLVLASQS